MWIGTEGLPLYRGWSPKRVAACQRCHQPVLPRWWCKPLLSVRKSRTAEEAREGCPAPAGYELLLPARGRSATVVARLHCSANLRCACSASRGGGREGHRGDGDGNNTARGGRGKRGLRCSAGYRLVFPARGPACADAPAFGRPAMRLLVPNSPHASNAGAGPSRLLVEGRVGDEQEDEEAGEESPVEWEGISRGRGHARDWGRLLGFPPRCTFIPLTVQIWWR
jgi:hypothetical protein